MVGNLPYNISTPLLFHAATFSHRCTDLHFMLQQEVVDRMVAEPSGSEYGRLSVMLQYRFQIRATFRGSARFLPACTEGSLGGGASRSGARPTSSTP